jgi:hypothetical protein
MPPPPSSPDSCRSSRNPPELKEPSGTPDTSPFASRPPAFLSQQPSVRLSGTSSRKAQTVRKTGKSRKGSGWIGCQTAAGYCPGSVFSISVSAQYRRADRLDQDVESSDARLGQMNW